MCFVLSYHAVLQEPTFAIVSASMWASRVPNVYTRAVFVLVIGFAGDSRGDKDRSAHATPHPRVADPDLVEDIVHELWSADHPPTQQEWVLLATLEPCSGDRRGIANPLHNLPHLPLICAAEPQTHPMFMQRPTTALPFHLLTTEVYAVQGRVDEEWERGAIWETTRAYLGCVQI